jgi:hypothetical protein
MRPLVQVTLAVCLASGCSFYAQTGKVMSGYAVEHVVPYMMQSPDVGMACGTGVAMGPFLMSFGRVTDPPDKAALVTMMAAGMCAEMSAWDDELAQLRSGRESRAAEMQDARVREQRLHELAADRYHQAYGRLVKAFGEPGGACPKLAGRDRLLYLLGLSSGLLAVMHDQAAGGPVGVPMDVPRKVAQAAACLDDAELWGVPHALQAAVWATVPGTAPEKTEPFAVLRAAAKLGQDQAVRLAGAFLVQAAAGAGRADELRRAITEHAESLKAKPAADDYRMLDRYATLLIQHESDKLWTARTGHRTPMGALGTFPEEATKTKPPADDDRILEGLDSEGAK